MLVSAPFMALRNEKTRNRPSTTSGGAPDHRPMIKKTTVMIHCCGTVNSRRPALSMNATVTATRPPRPSSFPHRRRARWQAVLLQHIGGERRDRKIGQHVAEPEPRHEDRHPPVLLGE